MRSGLLSSFLAVHLAAAAGCGSGHQAPLPDQADSGKPPETRTEASGEPESTPPAQPVRADAKTYSLTAKEFYDEYQRDKQSLTAKYKDAVMEISGEAVMASAAQGVPFVRLGVGIDEVTGVHCFTQEKQPWALVVPGQQVKLRGKLPERLFGAQLQDCEIVEAGPSPAIATSAESLAAELAADPKAMHAKYQDAYFFLEGTVDGFDDKLSCVVYLKGSAGVRVRCAFDVFGEQQQIPSLKVGSRVHVVGHYPHFGEDNEVFLQLCLLYDPQRAKPVPAAAVGESDRTPMSFVPEDAVAVLVMHPKRAAASEVGRAMLKLTAVQAGLRQSHIKPGDIERIIYAMGIPTDESENDCTIVHFAAPMQRASLLKEEFGPLSYEEVQFQGKTYYRYAHAAADDDIRRPEAEGGALKPSDREFKLLARYPDDLRPKDNGHADSSGSGNWFYQSSETQNPTSPEANLRQLNWDSERGRYQSPLRGNNNVFPSIGDTLHPSPDPPNFAVLRWQSRVSAEVTVRGNFCKLADAKQSNGVHAVIFVDGQRKFEGDVGPRDAKGVDFEFSASVERGSAVDFVVDPKGDAYWDATKLTATIQESAPGAAQPAPAAEPPAPESSAEGPASGTAVYFADDRTMVSTGERRLRSLIAGPSVSTPLIRKVSQIDLDHDLVGVVAMEGYPAQLAGLLKALSEDTGWAELGGLSFVPHFAEFAVATLDLSCDTLLRVTVDAVGEQSASEVEAAIDSLMDRVEGLRSAIPEGSPLLPMLKQFVKGTTLQTRGKQVSLTVKMPEGLADSVRDDTATAIAALAKGAIPPGEGVPAGDPDLENAKKLPDKMPGEFVYRTPPQDHPEFRDLAVRSHDCRVFFPGKPSFTEKNVKIAEGNVHVATFQGKTPRAAYLFEIYTYPKAFADKAGATALLRQTRDNLVDSPRGRLSSSEPLTYEGSPALDFVYVHPDTTGAGKGHCRIVMRENRVYLLEVDGVQIPPAEIKVFHESLAPYALPGGSSPGGSLTTATPKLKKQLPDQAARDKALQLVRSLYEKEFQSSRTSSERIVLARTMLDRAREVEEPAERFVLLDVARKMAAGAGGVDPALDAVAQLDGEFEIDALQLTSDSLEDLAKAVLEAEDRIRVAREMLAAARVAIETDRYELAVGLLNPASAGARKGRELVLAKSANDQLEEANQLKSQYEAIRPSLEKLSAAPDDAAANQAVGQYYCLAKGQWEKGLPHLAKASDARLKMLAEKELARPTTADAQVKLADQWFELAGEAKGLSEKHLQLHAAYWYRQALPNLPGLEKDAVEKRLSGMKHVVAAEGPKLVFLRDVPMFGTPDVLINDDKGYFREERLKGEKYPQVLWAHAKDDGSSHYAFTLRRKFSRLTGKAAINDVQSVARALKPQQFTIYGDKRLLWKSRPLQDKLDSEEFNLNVSNVTTLHFYVAGGGFGGHALWVDVVLEEK